MKKQTLEEQVSRIKGMIKSINEGEYDSRGNYMGGTPPEYDHPGADSYLEVDIEPDEFLKKKFGEDINVNVIDTKYDSGKNRYGDYYESVTFTLDYNDGEKLPDEMEKALDMKYSEIEWDGDEDEEGNEWFRYLVTQRESYDGFNTPD
jgi:hypothetical protein